MSLHQLNKLKSQLENKKLNKIKILHHRNLVLEKREDRRILFKNNYNQKKKLKSLQFKEDLELFKVNKKQKYKIKIKNLQRKKMINKRK